MDEFLSKLYGTESLVKEAAEEQQANEEVVGNFITGVETLCKEAGTDPDALSDDEVTSLWNEYVGELQKTAELENAPGAEKYAGLTQENFEQADAMGRIAAHANVDEMSKIAGAEHLSDEAVEAAIGAGKKGETAGKTVGRMGAAGSGRKGAVVSGTKLQRLLSAAKGRLPSSKAGKAAVFGIPAALAAGGTAAVLAGRKEKAAYDEEVTQAIQERAYEFLKEANWLFDTGEPIPPGVGAEIIKQAQEGEPEKKEKEEEGEEAEKQAFVQAVDEAALELLKENGYPINQ